MVTLSRLCYRVPSSAGNPYRYSTSQWKTISKCPVMKIYIFKFCSCCSPCFLCLVCVFSVFVIMVHKLHSGLIGAIERMDFSCTGRWLQLRRWSRYQGRGFIYFLWDFLGTGRFVSYPSLDSWYFLLFKKAWLFTELGVRLQNNVASRACASFSNCVASRAIAYF